MPIDFRCQHCGKLLRVGDETAGRQAQCPACGSVQTIPAATPAPELPSAPPARAAAAGGNPFGPPLPMPPAALGGEQNPYQAPPSYPGRETYGAPGAAGTPPYRATRIDIGGVLSRSWEVYNDQLWMCVAVFLLGLLVNYAAQVPSQIANAALPAAQLPLSAIIFTNLLLFVFQFVFQTWIGVGQTIFFLKVARGEAASAGMLFQGGPYLLRAILASLLFLLGLVAIAMLCAIPAVAVYFATKEPGPAIGVFVVVFLFPQLYAMLTFFQYFYLIVDRDLGVVESLSASREITRGNKLATFAVLLICGLLYIAGVFACCVGAIFTGAYAMLAMAVMYLAMSGAQTTAPRQ